MYNIISNIFAIIRGNLKCLIGKLFSKNCKYSFYIRMFEHSSLLTAKGSFRFGKGLTLGKRTSCVIRKNAKLEFGDMVYLNSDCKIVCRKSIKIGENTIFGPNVYIYDHDHIFDTETGVNRKEYKCSDVVIGKNCWIGAGTIILKGTRIGDNSVVGAGSVVKGTYEKGSRIIQKRIEEK